MKLSDAKTTVESTVAKLGRGALTESAIVEHVHPLFSRVLERNERSGEIYLANHSLGRPLDMVAHVIQGALDGWYTELDGVWGSWLNARELYRAQVAGLLNWGDPKGVVPKTSAAQGLRAVINALPTSRPKIVSSRCEFDSIDFVLKGYAHMARAAVRWIEPDEQDLLRVDDIIDAIDDSTDLVVVSAVCFVTGQQVEDLGRLIQHAHKHGCLVLLDTYHAMGVLDLDYLSLGADFLIGGNYKYTRGGAGACFLAINPRHLNAAGGVPDRDSVFSIDTGWFAKQDPFAYKRSDEPAYAPGGDAWLEATPPVLTYYQALPGLMLTSSIGVNRLRAYSLDQQRLLAGALEENGVSPRLLEHRGAYLLVEHDDGRRAMADLKQAGINVDARPLPRSGRWVVRFCPDILNTRDELIEAARRVGGVLGSD
ncbi:MAG: aminotransferase class V-fold PLP-dependent enzyme [bacterium]|nr:aminotransferase class V-fold PLP-dependent enzyme [bacterium]